MFYKELDKRAQDFEACIFWKDFFEIFFEKIFLEPVNRAFFWIFYKVFLILV